MVGYGRKIRFDDIEWKKSGNDPVDKPFGQDYVSLNYLINDYGNLNNRNRIGVIEFSDIDNKNELLQKTYEHLIDISRPQLQLKSKAFNESQLVELGEICTIIRDDLDIRYKTKVYKITTNLLNNIQDFEFGDKIYSTAVEKIKKIENKNVEMFSQLDEKIEDILNEVAKDFWGKDGFPEALLPNNKYKLQAGIYVFNKTLNENNKGFVLILKKAE